MGGGAANTSLAQRHCAEWEGEQTSVIDKVVVGVGGGGPSLTLWVARFPG